MINVCTCFHHHTGDIPLVFYEGTTIGTFNFPPSLSSCIWTRSYWCIIISALVMLHQHKEFLILSQGRLLPLLWYLYNKLSDPHSFDHLVRNIPNEALLLFFSPLLLLILVELTGSNESSLCFTMVGALPQKSHSSMTPSLARSPRSLWCSQFASCISNLVLDQVIAAFLVFPAR